VVTKREAYLTGALLLFLLGLYMALIWAPTERILGESSRILYTHVPVAWITYLSFTIALVASILYLVKKAKRFDTIAEVGVALGLIYGALTLIVGSIWANLAWGTYWNWDPRETTTLILWIAYAGYFMLRSSIENPERKASLSAIYNILAFFTIPLSYVSILYWQTLHPQIVTPKEVTLAASMRITLVVNLIASTMLYLYIFFLFYRTRRLEQRLKLRTEYEGGG
jgi:heme exporter protein C